MMELLNAFGDPLAIDKSLSISKNVVCRKSGDGLAVGLKRLIGKDCQIHLVIDAIHLWLQSEPPKKSLLRIFLHYEDKGQAELENAVAVLIKSLKESLKEDLTVKTQLVGEKEPQKFDEKPYGEKAWFDESMKKKDPPKIAKTLESKVSFFKLYRSVKGNYWSGRVGGLEVCSISSDGKCTLGVGSKAKKKSDYDAGAAKKKNPVKEAFEAVLKKVGEKRRIFTCDQIESLATAISALAEDRIRGELRKYQREHLLESQILSSAHPETPVFQRG
jgi:hypothetical protein